MSHGGVHAVKGQCLSNVGAKERKVSNGKMLVLGNMNVSGVITLISFLRNSARRNCPEVSTPGGRLRSLIEDLLTQRTLLDRDRDSCSVASATVVNDPDTKTVVVHLLVQRPVRSCFNVWPDYRFVVRGADPADIVNRNCFHYVRGVIDDLRRLFVREDVKVHVVSGLLRCAEFRSHLCGSHANTHAAILAIKRFLRSGNVRGFVYNPALGGCDGSSQQEQSHHYHYQGD